MKKVALLTMFKVPNYGSVLQSYASQIVLEKLGFHCDIINYPFPNEWHYNHGYRKGSKLRQLTGKILRNIGIKSRYWKNRLKIEKFAETHLSLTRQFNTLEELELWDWSQYDAVISGSDQVWNPRFMKGDKAFLLSFVPDNVKKISIASSFACSSIDGIFSQRYKKYLSRFDAISVRDNQGITVIENLGITTPVKSLLDPTLLLSADEWIDTLKIRQSGDTNYILVYILKYAFDSVSAIYDIATEVQRQCDNAKLIFIGDVHENIVKEFDNAEFRKILDVKEFVTLFANARAIVTSSFHGTAFAVNFAKPLVALTPCGGDDRQISLLKKLGIEHCAVNPDKSIDDVSINYLSENCTSKLSLFRESDLNWILKTI